MKYKLFVFDLDETLWSVSEGLCTLVQPPFTMPHANRVESAEGFWIEVKPGVRELFKYLKGEGCYVSLASRLRHVREAGLGEAEALDAVSGHVEQESTGLGLGLGRPAVPGLSSLHGRTSRSVKYIIHHTWNVSMYDMLRSKEETPWPTCCPPPESSAS